METQENKYIETSETLQTAFTSTQVKKRTYTCMCFYQGFQGVNFDM